MPTIRCCKIRGCNSGYNTYLKRVPRGRLDSARRQKWLQYCIPGTVNLKYPFVCIYHFSAAQCIDADKKVLKSNAVPDINLPRPDSEAEDSSLPGPQSGTSQATSDPDRESVSTQAQLTSPLPEQIAPQGTSLGQAAPQRTPPGQAASQLTSFGQATSQLTALEEATTDQTQPGQAAPQQTPPYASPAHSDVTETEVLTGAELLLRSFPPVTPASQLEQGAARIETTARGGLGESVHQPGPSSGQLKTLPSRLARPERRPKRRARGLTPDARKQREAERSQDMRGRRIVLSRELRDHLVHIGLLEGCIDVHDTITMLCEWYLLMNRKGTFRKVSSQNGGKPDPKEANVPPKTTPSSSGKPLGLCGFNASCFPADSPTSKRDHYLDDQGSAAHAPFSELDEDIEDALRFSSEEAEGGATGKRRCRDMDDPDWKPDDSDSN